MDEAHRRLLDQAFLSSKPTVPKPPPPVKRSRRSRRRHRAKMRVTGWSAYQAWHQMGRILASNVEQVVNRKGFIGHAQEAMAAMTWKSSEGFELRLTAEEVFGEPKTCPAMQQLCEAEDARILAAMLEAVNGSH